MHSDTTPAVTRRTSAGARTEGEPRNDADDVVAVGDEVGPDANELDADNAVEEETIETVDPDNAPA